MVPFPTALPQGGFGTSARLPGSVPKQSRVIRVKSFGYLLSILSVFLLAAGSFKTASQQPLLLLCLLAGVATSVVGMLLRFVDYRREQREKRA
jgi:hypothetical protein